MRKEKDRNYFCNSAVSEATWAPGFLFTGLINDYFYRLYSKSCGEFANTITLRTDFNLGSLW